MTILVTGGAGYIGSHVVKALGLNGENIVVLDNLSTGHREAVLHGKLVVGDLSDIKLLDELFSEYKFESVMHFAGSIVVPESVRDPLKYYRNNTLNSALLLEKCLKYQTKYLIFSSTAAVYGMPENGICDETSPLSPINPYGQSKLMTEQMICDATKVSQLKSVTLRYFNVAGADPDGQIGQSFPEATHLMKVACGVAAGKKPTLQVYGSDYPTCDGTCIRDYIHVTDLANAHVKSLEYLRRGGESAVLNCGYGHGFSVNEVVERVKKVSGENFSVEFSSRRSGDPAMLVAKSERIYQVLDWKPQYDDLDFIIKTALAWEKKL